MGRPHSTAEGLSLCYQHEHELQGAMSWDPGCLESFSLGKETGKEEWELESRPWVSQLTAPLYCF